MQPKVKSVVIKNDGTEYVGYILSRDAREILIEVADLGEMYIPMHEIKSIREIDEEAYYSSGEVFATRYFITTNGLPLRKGDNYALFNIFGPEIHSNVADNVSMGLMTSWVAIPLVGSMKFSIPAGENVSLGIGTLIGTGLWAGLEHIGALVYGSFTMGDYANNITFSGGYLGATIFSETMSAPLASVACMFAINQNFSFVGDSFIVMKKGSSGALIIPGVRYSKSNDRAFQFGLAGIVAGGEAVPFPIPYLGFFRAF